MSNYSTEEQVIGTLIDGKNVYQKIFTNLNISCGTTANVAKLTGCICPDADKLIDVELYDWDGVVGNQYTYYPTLIGITSSHEIRFTTNNTTSNLTIRTILAKYTKKTDKATTN